MHDYPTGYRGKPVPSGAKEVLDLSAFIPFSFGPANCAGRNLALLEMRAVVALLVQRFSMKFADGFDPESWNKNWKDLFVVSLGELLVELTPRF